MVPRATQILGFLQRQVDDVAWMQQRLPAGEQVIEADADRDAGVDAGPADDRRDGLAAMRIGAVRAGQDDQLRPVDGLPEREVRLDPGAQRSPASAGGPAGKPNATT